MNFGEMFIETATREIMKETGLIIESLSLLGIYSGKDLIVEHPNNDVVFEGVIVFKAKKYSGEFNANPNESQELRFFNRENLPHDIWKSHKIRIEQWRKGQNSIYVG